jgi:hypothetical protein
VEAVDEVEEGDQPADDSIAVGALFEYAGAGVLAIFVAAFGLVAIGFAALLVKIVIGITEIARSVSNPHWGLM